MDKSAIVVQSGEGRVSQAVAAAATERSVLSSFDPSVNHQQEDNQQANPELGALLVAPNQPRPEIVPLGSGSELVTLVVLALALLGSWWVRFRARGGNWGSRSSAARGMDSLACTDRLALTPQIQLATVRFGDRRLLLALSGQRVELLVNERLPDLAEVDSKLLPVISEQSAVGQRPGTLAVVK